MDLMLVIAIMLLLFLGLFQFYISKAESASIVRGKTSAKELSEGLAGRINAVLNAGNGTIANYSLPETLSDGKDYGISVSNRRVEISFESSTISSQITTSNINSIDLNSRKGTEIGIKNENGKIIIS